MKVTVVGAGVTGLAIACELLERGAGEVTVLDRSGVGAGASGVQPGGVRRQWATRANCLMANESYAFYRDFPERVGTVAQARLEECGYLFVADEVETLGRLASALEVQHAAGIPSELLGPEAAAAKVPALNREALLGAAWCSTDGYFDRPQAVVEAFAEAVIARGGRIAAGEVTGIARDGGGWRVELRSDEAVQSDAVVVAAAASTAALVAPLGIELPIAEDARHLFYSDPIRERLLEPLVIAVDRGIAVKQLADGRVLASDLHARGGDEDAWRRRLRSQLVELLPALEFVPLPLAIEGLYDMTPDGQPIVCELDAGLWAAAGFSGHGFMVAPSTGRLVADGLTGRPLPEWGAALRADRFAGALEREAQVI
jgi:sarcosine oxidase, subunit beta